MTFRINGTMRVTEADLAWWLARHDSYKWHFAHTMPQAPHSYIWKGRQIPEEEYDRMFGVVGTFGEPGKYWDRTQLYLHNRVRGIRYWLMDWHYYTCLILNMADDGREYGEQNAPSTRTRGWSEYDEIAPWWDDYYRELEPFDSTALWKTVHHNVLTHRPTLLDLGAGTGGTLDARVAPSTHTTAVDPSQGMLNTLVLKYPNIRKVVPSSVAEYLYEGERHELVVASFGSASYLTPEEIAGAHALAQRLTVLSFYAPGRQPTHRTDLPATHEAALQRAMTLPGAVAMTHGNFQHVVVRPVWRS